MHNTAFQNKVLGKSQRSCHILGGKAPV